MDEAFLDLFLGALPALRCFRRSRSSGSPDVAERLISSAIFAVTRELSSMNFLRSISSGCSSSLKTPESGMLKTTSKPLRYLTGKSVSGHSSASMTAAVQAMLKSGAMSFAVLHLCSSSTSRSAFTKRVRNRKRSRVVSLVRRSR